jgi:phosphoribosylformylglycinamidine cyclo-ligase
VIVAAEHAEQAKSLLQAEGEIVYTLGAIRARVGDEHQTQVR